MRAAIDTLAELAAGRKAVAILGDMLELGAEETVEHEKIGTIVAGHRAYGLIAVGDRARHLARTAAQHGLARVVITGNPLDAARTVASWTDPGDWILVKASRGMRLERVIESLKEVVG
jgi:UDP-N-acetylmuramyl pentapeptide synthase